MPNTITADIAKWYTGKALAAITGPVEEALARAQEQGGWSKGDARKVRAALNKQAVAAKIARTHEDLLKSVSTGDSCHSGAKGWTIAHALCFGSLSYVTEVASTVSALRTGTVRVWSGPHKAAAPTAAERATLDGILAQAEQWAHDFAPIAALVAELDRSMRRPVIKVATTLSPTTAAALTERTGVDLAAGVSVPPIEWRIVEMMVDGKALKVPVGTILWPEGTRHNVSAFAEHASNCHACGHRISNPWNWIPLVTQDATGPISLWVGRDCAHNLFGVDVTADEVHLDRA